MGVSESGVAEGEGRYGECGGHGEMGDIEDVEEFKRRARDSKMHVERI